MILLLVYKHFVLIFFFEASGKNTRQLLVEYHFFSIFSLFFHCFLRNQAGGGFLVVVLKFQSKNGTPCFLNS